MKFASTLPVLHLLAWLTIPSSDGKDPEEMKRNVSEISSFKLKTCSNETQARLKRCIQKQFVYIYNKMKKLNIEPQGKMTGRICTKLWMKLTRKGWLLFVVFPCIQLSLNFCFPSMDFIIRSKYRCHHIYHTEI